jgi:hypothetical protein
MPLKSLRSGAAIKTAYKDEGGKIREEAVEKEKKSTKEYRCVPSVRCT